VEVVIFATVFQFINRVMHRLSGYLLLALLFFAVIAKGQEEQTKPDTTVPNATVTDTTVLQSTSVVDTVKHVYNIDSLNKSMDSLNKVKIVKDEKEFLQMQKLQGENDKLWMKKQILALSYHNMYGRGYVNGGTDSAAVFVLRKFREYKVKPVTKNGSYLQGFAFPVNTFPGKMKLVVNSDSLSPGYDFIIDPSSSSYTGENMNVRKMNLNDIADAEAWKQTMAKLDGSRVYYLENVDLFCSKILNVPREIFLSTLPKGCYIIPQEDRLRWGVSRDTMAATVFYVRKKAMPKVLKTVNVNVNSLFIPRYRSDNIVGCIPGVAKDTFIVFTSHYDYLGMMGNATIYPGANDGASGLAMMLYLASFYAKHTPHYSILFAAFAGEEASLMGSEFFVKDAPIPLKSIRFLVNLDMMGDATKGISVVNATEYPAEFGILKEINDREKFVPEIRGRRLAANGDQYYFARAGVPSFFVYGEGEKLYYHDLNDHAKDITLNKIDGVARLLIAFEKELK